MSRRVPCCLMVCMLLGCSSESSSSSPGPSATAVGEEEGPGGPGGSDAGSCDELLTCVCGDLEPAASDSASCKSMRTIVDGYRRDYGDAAADSHCAGQLTITGLSNCGSTEPPPSTLEDGALIGACNMAPRICIEHYANAKVAQSNGSATCAINGGTWQPGMPCPEENLLGYCEDLLEKYGQTLHYYRVTGNDEKRLSADCETGWHASEGSG